MDSKKPMHNQIADILRQRIAAGKYEKNGLPPELVLVDEFGVSRHTIRSAMQRLVTDGLIERRAGRGTTVTRRASGGAWLVGSLDDLLEFTVDRIQSIEASLVPARDFPHVTALFGTSARGRVFRMLRALYTAGGQICSVASLFTSAAIAARLPRELFTTTLLINLIEQHCAVRAEQVRQVSSAGVADAAVARQLEMKVGAPVLLLYRTYTSTDGKPIMYVELTCRPDRYQQTVTFIHERSDRAATPASAAAAEEAGSAKPSARQRVAA